ncbi:hypothetical protein [Myxococcus xanthus]|uniref:hypothetical protein n=1 Tax=Myxococcus xanthus TaxID=34 RepID=UPI00148D40B4|nr:hypothetical protein [Myxococcus xanthus]NOJ90085.1 hypothetical protein [Myxococcus xanthus]
MSRDAGKAHQAWRCAQAELATIVAARPACHPLRGLKMKSPREFRTANATLPELSDLPEG